MRIFERLRRLRGLDARRRVPTRRDATTIKFEHAGFKWFATTSEFEDGELAELFLSTAKTGDMLRNMASDGAIAASLALQYGCPLSVLRAALARDTGGEPLSPLAAALDRWEKGI